MDRYPDILGAADVLVALLEPTAGTFSVPSKVLSYLCAGRPILAAIPPENLAARTIERAGAGLVVPADRRGVVPRGRQAAPHRRGRCAPRPGDGRRAYAEATFDTEVITDRFQDVIERAVRRRSSATGRKETLSSTWTTCWSPAPVASSAATSCERLRDEGVGRIRAVDVKPKDEWYQVFDDVENLHANLELLDACHQAADGVDTIFNLAADMGGMGFIENNKALCMLSVLVSTHVLVAARDAGVERVFYSSSACVYAADKQTSPEVVPLREPDAYPAMPEDGYGWEKLFSERMSRHFAEDFGIETRVARYHNIYGPEGTWDGGREKAPAAICRKVATAALTGDHTIEIWGDGEQTRSFTYIDDCLEGTLRLTGQRRARAAQRGQRPAGHDQRAGRHRRGHRRHHARAPLQARRAAGRPRPQQRQHPRPRARWAGRRRSASRTASRPPTPGCTTRSRPAWRGLSEAVAAGVNRRRALVMADQGVSSLSNVVVSIFVARSLSSDGFGAFGVATVVYLLVQGTSRALIGEPLLSRFSSADAATRRHLVPDLIGATLTISALGAAAVVVVGLAVGGAAGLGAAGAGAACSPWCWCRTPGVTCSSSTGPAAALAVDLVWLAAVFAALLVAPAGRRPGLVRGRLGRSPRGWVRWPAW